MKRIIIPMTHEETSRFKEFFEFVRVTPEDRCNPETAGDLAKAILLHALDRFQDAQYPIPTP